MFAVKGSRFITHMKKLADADTRWPTSSPQACSLSGTARASPVAAAADLGLRPRTGWPTSSATLPRTLGAVADLAARHDHRITADRALITTDRPDHPVRHALEIRHDSFGRPRSGTCSASTHIALVWADNPGMWPVLDETTTDFRYVRLHGDTELYASGYTARRSIEWAGRISGWVDAGQDVYVYCDNDAKVRAPYDAMGLMDRLGLTKPAP